MLPYAVRLNCEYNGRTPELNLTERGGARDGYPSALSSHTPTEENVVGLEMTTLLPLATTPLVN